MAAGRRANGEGSIYKNNARNRWEGALTIRHPDGSSTRRKVTGRTRTEVRTKLKALQKQVDDGAAAIDRTSTVKQYADRWVEHTLPMRDVKARTRRDYTDIVHNYVIPTWGHHRLIAMKPGTVEIGLRALAEKGYSKDTVRLAKAVLNFILDDAERNELIPRNPVRLVRMPRMAPGKARKAMSKEQVHTLLAATSGTNLHGPLLVALTTGLRPGELLNLRWSDLDLDSSEPSLTVLESKTERGRRTVRLVPAAVDALKTQRQELADKSAGLRGGWVEEDWVFPSDLGTKWDLSNFRKAFKKACLEAGLGDWTPHELRHTAATWMIDSGLPLKVASETLGHASITVTADVYGHLIKPSDAVADAFESLLSPDENDQAA